MTVLILGSGGREHAIALAVSKDPQVQAVHVAPGNPGTASFATNHEVDETDPDAVVALGREISADLVVVGPEAPLVAGVADAVRAAGIDCFGPGKEAARLEGSKAFAKEIMRAAGVPTADAVACTTVEEAEAALDRFGAPYVVKDDGLAAGKGVVVTSERSEAVDHARHCIEAGHPIVIEEYLKGPEVSLFAICDGSRALPLQPAQDFKRVGDGGTGPNTGGMGAYTPLPWAPADLVETVTRTVIGPTLAEMNRRGTPFQGLLYVGLSLTADGPRVVEFNVRFGDPETQPLLSMIESPLGQVMRAAATGDLSGFDGLRFRRGFAVGVVLASEGYPGEVVTGRPVGGVLSADGDSDPDIIQAGTAADGDRLVSAGGRVLVALGHGETLTGARQAAYARIEKVSLEGGFHRGDIALTAAEEEAFTALSEPKESLGDPGAND
ncbi:phosphoribosylamine--glycine ligase [Acidipropionibacterium virtanenii]|uniref:Phosphoribosylamine--glycine ligase n=1 Tax=Acidipropionibacterium virtanenii TaxID=2057246 RepID=A0A344URQ6_9ACTN|nr:phosphoribosylamine--glycine ligase [Acidipropionibacterium virtanenii]AXE37954.1 Phosphoribosylamine--glycine ligase [Acidipropionibacterium virtanenii]